MLDKEMMTKLMAKKGGDIDPAYKDSKLSVLQELMDLMDQMGGDDVKGLKQVTVAAPDKDGLNQGLEKAKDMLSSDADSDSSDVCPDCGGDHGDDEDHTPMDPDADGDDDTTAEGDTDHDFAGAPEDSPEAIDAKIEQLMKMKQMMLAKK